MREDEHMRIHGICHRAGFAPSLGPDVIIPESVPLTVNFNHSYVLGRAILRRDANGDIHAEAEISYDPVIARRIVPYFSIQVSRPVLVPAEDCPAGRITSGELTQVAAVERCDDPDQPPYEIVPA